MEANFLSVTRGNGVERASSFSMEKPSILQVPIEVRRRNSVPTSAFMTDFSEAPLERVRSFSITPKGLRNRGDKIRRKSTLSIETNSSYQSNTSLQEIESRNTGCNNSNDSLHPMERFTVAVIGSDGVGMNTLKRQFTTSEELCINNCDSVDNEEEVCVCLDGEECLLSFVKEEDFMIPGFQSAVDTVLVIFSVIDAQSYKSASRKLQSIRQELHFDRPVFLVANKVDLARTRVVSEKEARKLADKYKCKYVETSVVLNHNIDELLVGIVRQVRYQQEGCSISSSTESISKNRNKVAKFTNILLDKIMNIGHKEIPCTNLFDV
ncbi:GTP-binding protein RAD-like [Saccostrea cucullata]|uniref:GTP-binding protein RAD-like n=1 Tax=Saccostrea cuccullata TaxID=36930 RepID=UPI002ED33701